MPLTHRFQSVKYLFLLVFLLLFLSGCSTHKASTHNPEVNLQDEAGVTTSFDDEFELEDEFEDTEESRVFDPLSGYNRLMTGVNDKVYFYLLKPTAQGYRAIVPEGGRLMVNRFFRNLLMPVRFTNNLLQLKPKEAGTELTRFILNTTIGFLGFFDPAEESFNLQAYPEDFGQTLGHYGVGSGFHVVLPLLGPSNLRDTVGLIPDHFLSPTTHLNDSEARLALRGYKTINNTSLHIGEYESIKKDAVDLYTFLRDGYEQRRDKLIEE
jgi:phospholipid-binding lipoprotein MlaA